MASTVSNGNDRSAKMASTVLRNGIDRFKWQRPYTKGKFAAATQEEATGYEENSVREYCAKKSCINAAGEVETNTWYVLHKQTII